MNQIKMTLLAATLLAGTSFAQTTTAPSTTDRDAHRAKVEAAMEAGDYNAWKTEHDAWGGNGKNADKVTPENFALFTQMHAARKAGDMEKAEALRTQLGFEQRGNGKGQGKGAGKGKGSCDGTGSKGSGKGKGKHAN